MGLQASTVPWGGEKAYCMGKDANGNYVSTPISNPGAGLSAPWPSFNDNTISVLASVHTHPDVAYGAPSIGDILSTAIMSHNNSSYEMSIIIAENGDQYTLVIDNKQLLENFRNDCANEIDGDHFKDNTAIRDYFKNAHDGFIAAGLSNELAYEQALALILDQFNIGLSLVKREAGTNNFKPIVSSVDSQNGITTYKKENCP